MKITSARSTLALKHQAVSWAIRCFQSKLLFLSLKHTKIYIVWLDNLIAFKIKTSTEALVDVFIKKKRPN